MKNTIVNGTPHSNTVADHTTYTSLQTNELLAKLRETEQQLKETQLRLCEMEFEKVEFNRKYLYFKRQADYWEEQSKQFENSLQTILNSKFWKLRGRLLAPFNRFHKDNNDTNVPAFSETVRIFPVSEAFPSLPTNNDWESALMTHSRIAVQAHVFYPDLIKDITTLLDNIPYPYDLYITTTESYKATYIKEHLIHHSSAENFQIELVENKGRDVIPFLKQMQPVLPDYDYLCHLHTKRSLHNDSGKLWRNYLYDNLMGSCNQIRKILYEFESNNKVGIMFPEIPPALRNYMNLGENRELALNLLNYLQVDSSNLEENLIFPAGTMFWARTDAVKDLFTLDFNTSEVPEEEGQVDATIMHAIERLWVYVAEQRGYTYRMFKNISQITDI